MFWKGRDSRRERLDLIKIARKEISKYSVFGHFFLSITEMTTDQRP